jgi:hypothetical protein
MPVDLMLGMDCIPLHNMCPDWRANRLSMDLHPGVLAPGAVLQRDSQGREVRQQWLQLYMVYGKMNLPYVTP